MPDLKVVSRTQEEYGENFHSNLLEQYKLTRTTITDLQNDRNTNNRFLISICTALFGLEGFIIREVISNADKAPTLILIASSLVPLLGVYISYLWIKWARSYGIALKSRYAILKGMESHFPSQPFTREFVLRSEEGYIPISDIAINLSKFFLGGFLLLLTISIVQLAF
jgi:hypothetical protein